MARDAVQIYGSLTDSFWENYVKGRPQVPDSLFKRIFEYHACHGGKFDVVNDVGAGVGNHSVRFADKFKTVVITEPDETSLRIAKTILRKEAIGVTQYCFVRANAEDNIQKPGSIDMVFIANALHWTDLNKSLESFAKQLRPGGTLCIGVFGLTILMNEKVDRVWVKLFSVFYADVKAKLGEQYVTGDRKQSIDVQNSGGLSVPLPEEIYRPGVQRIQLNAEKKYAFNLFRDFPMDFEIRTGPNDHIISETSSDWYFEADLARLKLMFRTFPFGDDHEEEVNSLWREMESILDGGTTRGYWPAGFVLATRK